MKNKEIKKLEERPEDIKIVYVEAVFMPNGELLRYGKSLGFQKTLEGIYEIVEK
jgi:hypothetical protein